MTRVYKIADGLKEYLEWVLQEQSKVIVYNSIKLFCFYANKDKFEKIYKSIYWDSWERNILFILEYINKESE